MYLFLYYHCIIRSCFYEVCVLVKASVSIDLPVYSFISHVKPLYVEQIVIAVGLKPLSKKIDLIYFVKLQNLNYKIEFINL